MMDAGSEDTANALPQPRKVEKGKSQLLESSTEETAAGPSKDASEEGCAQRCCLCIRCVGLEQDDLLCRVFP